jgi:hypothetical protein
MLLRDECGSERWIRATLDDMAIGVLHLRERCEDDIAIDPSFPVQPGRICSDTSNRSIIGGVSVHQSVIGLRWPSNKRIISSYALRSVHQNGGTSNVGRYAVR